LVVALPHYSFEGERGETNDDPTNQNHAPIIGTGAGTKLRESLG